MMTFNQRFCFVKNILSKGTLLCSFSSSFEFSLVSFCVLFGLHFLPFLLKILAFLCVLLSNLVFFCHLLCSFWSHFVCFWSPFVFFLVSFCVIFGLSLCYFRSPFYCSLLGWAAQLGWWQYYDADIFTYSHSYHPNTNTNIMAPVYTDI